jgi:hypothetical protein
MISIKTDGESPLYYVDEDTLELIEIAVNVKRNTHN